MLTEFVVNAVPKLEGKEWGSYYWRLHDLTCVACWDDIF